MDVFSDNFDRADNVDLGPNWEPIHDGSNRDLWITNNRVRVSGLNITCTEFYTGPAPINDQYAQVEIKTFSGVQNEAGIGLRMQNTPATWTGYFFYGSDRGAGTTTELIKVIAGAGALIASENATTWVANDIIRAQVIGTALRIYRNGVSLLTGSDTAIAAGTFGVYMLTQAPDTVGQNEIDNFAGGEFIADDYSKFPKCVIQQAVELGWLT